MCFGLAFLGAACKYAVVATAATYSPSQVFSHHSTTSVILWAKPSPGTGRDVLSWFTMLQKFVTYMYVVCSIDLIALFCVCGQHFPLEPVPRGGDGF